MKCFRLGKSEKDVYIIRKLLWLRLDAPYAEQGLEANGLSVYTCQYILQNQSVTCVTKGM